MQNLLEELKEFKKILEESYIAAYNLPDIKGELEMLMDTVDLEIDKLAVRIRERGADYEMDRDW
ncbi:hypothetical protein LCGC14_1974330 [marine sediment metagenome]|uniref:Uncharacterized protein n=1 Tax=marine sediment metagenome TaxID=412755 RepID=A0A0F9FZ03_9ZZZZ